MDEEYFSGFESKTGKVIYLGVLAIVPGFVLSMFLYFLIAGPSSRELMARDYLQQNAKGIVDSVYNDAANHNRRMMILNDGIAYNIEDETIIDIEKGDSISKKRGSFILEVFRKPNKKLILDYRTLLPKN